MKPELILASNNDHKIREISSMTENLLVIKSLEEIGFGQEIPEDEPTLEGNALFKAQIVHRFCHRNVFSDDTGLEVEALNGRPGVHSARYAGEMRDSSDNIRKLLLELEGVTNRRARFRTVIALIWKDKEYLFEGIVEGEIAMTSSGTNGFGYDPLFIPSGFKKTFAELADDQKNDISHRAKATRKMVAFIEKALLQ